MTPTLRTNSVGTAQPSMSPIFRWEAAGEDSIHRFIYDHFAAQYEKKGKAHPVLQSLGWEIHGEFCRELLKWILLNANSFQTEDSRYDAKRHAKALSAYLSDAAPHHDGRLSEKVRSCFLRDFLVACMCLYYQQTEDISSIVLADLAALKERLGDATEFAGLSAEGWNLCLRFYNYLLVCIRFVDARTNKIKLVASAALLCGITTCLQGGNPTLQTKRLYRLFEVATATSTDSTQDSSHSRHPPPSLPSGAAHGDPASRIISSWTSAIRLLTVLSQDGDINKLDVEIQVRVKSPQTTTSTAVSPASVKSRCRLSPVNCEHCLSDGSTSESDNSSQGEDENIHKFDVGKEAASDDDDGEEGQYDEEDTEEKAVVVGEENSQSKKRGMSFDGVLPFKKRMIHSFEQRRVMVDDGEPNLFSAGRF